MDNQKIYIGTIYSFIGFCIISFLCNLFQHNVFAFIVSIFTLSGLIYMSESAMPSATQMMSSIHQMWEFDLLKEVKI